MNVSAHKLEDALMFNPFEGDFGEPEDRQLKDKIVKFRKGHVCHICGEGISKGTTGRNIVSVFDGELLSFYFCGTCCEAMVISVSDFDEEDDFDSQEAICKRYELGNINHNQKEKTIESN